MNIKFTVRGQELKVITPITLVSDSIGYLNAEFAFSADWDGLDKWVHLKNSDGATYNLELKDDRVSGLNLGAGRWSVWVHGNDITPEIPSTRITTGVVAFTVSTSGVCIDGVLPYIPPTAEEQIAANAANALREVQSLREDMDELEKAAQAAKIFSEKSQLSAEAASDSAGRSLASARSARDFADASAQSAAEAANSARVAKDLSNNAESCVEAVVGIAAQVGQDRHLAERAAMEADGSAKFAAESAVTAVRASAEAEASAKEARYIADRIVGEEAWVATEIDETGHLILSHGDAYRGSLFELNENGNLEVILS